MPHSPRRKPTREDGRPYRGGGCMTGEKREGSSEFSIHPVVRRLETIVTKSLPVGPIQRVQRFKPIVKSLAAPVALLLDASRLSTPQKSKIDTEFKTACLALWDLDAAATDLDLDYIKYQVSIMMQAAVADVDPETGHKVPVPSSSVGQVSRKHLFGGILLREIRRQIARAREGRRDSLSLMASFLLVKRGWPELSQQKRWDSVADHQMYLSRVPPSLPKDCLAHVRQAVTEIVKPTFVYSKLSPSRNASLQSSRKTGGAYGVVVEETYHLPASKPAPQLGGTRQSGGLKSPGLYQVARSIGAWKSKLWQRVQAKVVLGSSPISVPKPQLGGRQMARHIRAVRLQVIPEPAKFRIITAGDAYLNTFLQPLQGHLLRSWAQSRYSTMSADWEKKVEGFVAPDGWVWNSGDYKAATDQLNMNATLEAESMIKKVLGLEIPTDLGGTWIRYPRKELDPQKPRLTELLHQQNGQLMGHPLSFPILCMINLAGLLVALTRGRAVGMLSKEDCELILSMTIINGDDILFPCPKGFCRIWEKAASDVGLKLSVGKSYASAHFAMVNNVMFLMTRHGGRQLGYLNQGLVYNHSLKRGEATKSPFEIGHAFNKMFNAYPATVAFLSDAVSNRKEHPVMGYQPNFFIPCQLGGLGVEPRFADKPVGFTREQRQVAALCAEGVLNSFLISSGAPASKDLKRLLKLLPELRLSSAARAEAYHERYIHHGPLPILFSDATELGLDPDVFWTSPESYQSWVALFMSVLPPSEVRSSRIRFNKVKVTPMSVRKIKNFHADWLFPVLPVASTTFAPYYPGSRARKHLAGQ